MPDSTLNRRKVSPVRVILFSLLVTLLMAVELYAHQTVFPDFIKYLTEIDHKSCAWIGGQLSFMLPFITLCVFQYCVYRKDENGDGVMQREKMWEIVLIAVLVYAVLLPYVRHYSITEHEAALAALIPGTGDHYPRTPGGVDKTVMLRATEWFIRLTVPLMLLGLYHGARADREAKEYAAAPAAGTDPVPDAQVPAPEENKEEA